MFITYITPLIVLGMFLLQAVLALHRHVGEQPNRPVSDGGGPAIKPLRRNSVASTSPSTPNSEPVYRDLLPDPGPDGIPFQGGNLAEIHRACAEYRQFGSDNSSVESEVDDGAMGTVELPPVSAYDDADRLCDTVEISGTGVFVPVDEPEVTMTDEEENLLREILQADLNDGDQTV